MEREKDIQTASNEAGERFAANAKEVIDRINEASRADDTETCEAAEREIDEWPLSVSVREGWHSVGEQGEIAEYEILLSTGGPASRIWGELGKYNEPETAFFEYQDWFQPWTRAHLTEEQRETVLQFAQRFYFGE